MNKWARDMDLIMRKQQRELLGIDPRQHRTYQQLMSDKRLQPNNPQLPCDHGLFSDEANQLDLVEMLQDPTNGE